MSKRHYAECRGAPANTWYFADSSTVLDMAHGIPWQ